MPGDLRWIGCCRIELKDECRKVNYCRVDDDMTTRAQRRKIFSNEVFIPQYPKEAPPPQASCFAGATHDKPQDTSVKGSCPVSQLRCRGGSVGNRGDLVRAEDQRLERGSEG